MRGDWLVVPIFSRAGQERGSSCQGGQEGPVPSGSQGGAESGPGDQDPQATEEQRIRGPSLSRAGEVRGVNLYRVDRELWVKRLCEVMERKVAEKGRNEKWCCQLELSRDVLGMDGGSLLSNAICVGQFLFHHPTLKMSR